MTGIYNATGMVGPGGEGRVPRQGGPSDDAKRSDRAGFVDAAKGWSIIMVVLMHAALGVGVAVGARGWLHDAVAFAKPFRMPDFFIVAGLFAGAALNGPWRRFADAKLLHFAYFYALWLAIELSAKAGELGIATAGDFARAFLDHLVEPFGSMWFIQVLPLLFLATRLVRRLPVALVLAGATALHYWAAASPGPSLYTMESRATPFTATNGFSLFWVYFLLGHHCRNAILRFAGWAARSGLAATAALLAWAAAEAFATARGVTEVFGLDLPFGLAGAGAVIASAALLDRFAAFDWLRAVGRDALPVYLSFFLPMAASRIALVGLFPTADAGLLSLVVTTVAIGGALLLRRLVAGTPLAFLFERPGWARLAPPQPAISPRTSRAKSAATSASAMAKAALATRKPSLEPQS